MATARDLFSFFLSCVRGSAPGVRRQADSVGCTNRAAHKIPQYPKYQLAAAASNNQSLQTEKLQLIGGMGQHPSRVLC